ncbi:MAG: NRAMP family divalent metal transporter [Terriglobales bacterium]
MARFSLFSHSLQPAFMVPVKERRDERRLSPHRVKHPHGATARALGLGLITGAADDDPVAIGTYASAGASFGPSLLWIAPALLPMMAVIVYLASKLGRVTGQGLAAIIKAHYPRWILWLVAPALVVSNAIEGGASLGGVAAALNLLIPWPLGVLVVVVGAALLAVQVYGSYTGMRNAFRWLALALLAYVGSAALARPNLAAVARATVLPHIRLDRDFLMVLVAIIGTALSPYLYVWQVSQEVEEDIAVGKRRLSDRLGTSAAELRATRWDVLAGMVFDVVVMYFILLSTAATIYPVPWGSLHTAAEAAQALRPLAGQAAGALFAAGVIGVGLLAVPVMTVGAAYVVCDAMGWKSGLSTRPREARRFYAVIAAMTVAAVGFNFLGFNPIRALVGAGIVQGALAPGLMLLILLLTNNRAVVGPWTNTRAANALGFATFALASAAVVALIVSL